MFQITIQSSTVEVLSDDQLCVVGSESAIEKAKDVFMETKPLVSC